MTASLASWIFFTAVIALLPLVFHGFSIHYHGDPFRLSYVVGHGELLLVCAAMAGSAMGRACICPKKTARVLLCGTCLTIVVLATACYADVAPAPVGSAIIDPPLGGGVDTGRVASMSIAVFIGAIVVGISAIAVTKEIDSDRH